MVRAFRCIVLIQLLLVEADSARRRTHLRMEAALVDRSRVSAKVGTPPKLFFFTLELSRNDLVILDYGCKYPEHAMHCPRWRRMFCVMKCQQPDNIKICKRPELLMSNSSTLQYLNDVQLTYSGYSSFYGQRVSDNFDFVATKFKKSVQKSKCGYVKCKALGLKQQQFLRGVSTRLTEKNQVSGLMGLRPGPKSFVPQLKTQGHINNAIISIQKTVGTVMFGALDKSACSWRRLPGVHPDEWSFEISDPKFVDTQDNGTYVLESSEIQIPERLVDHYVQSGLLKYTPATRIGGRSLNVAPENKTRLMLEFKVGGELVKLTPEILVDSTVITYLAATGERRYAHEAEWVFGVRLLESFCFGYDYETGEVAWGRRRRPLHSIE